MGARTSELFHLNHAETRRSVWKKRTEIEGLTGQCDDKWFLFSNFKDGDKIIFFKIWNKIQVLLDDERRQPMGPVPLPRQSGWGFSGLQKDSLHDEPISTVGLDGHGPNNDVIETAAL